MVVYLEPDRDLISELSIEGGKSKLVTNGINDFVYSAISILVGINFEALPGAISLIFLAALGFGLGEIWVPKENGVTWSYVDYNFHEGIVWFGIGA